MSIYKYNNNNNLQLSIYLSIYLLLTLLTPLTPFPIPTRARKHTKDNRQQTYLSHISAYIFPFLLLAPSTPVCKSFVLNILTCSH